MYRYENTSSVYRRPKIPRKGSSPDFGQHCSPFPVSQWALKQLPYTVTHRSGLSPDSLLRIMFMMQPLRYNHYTYSTRIFNMYHIIIYFL